VSSDVPPAWRAGIEPLQDGQVQRITLRCGRQRLSYADFLEHLALQPGFRAFFNRLLADAPYAAFFWELPPVTQATAAQAFECVLVDSPALAGVAADTAAFAGHCRQSGGDVAVFPNLGQDAWLVAPCPRGPGQGCAHLAAFVRDAPPVQQQAFWQRLGETALGRLSGEPLWLSTSGLGVYWLHARLDSRPKYYTWRPYLARI
jgi:hypothetical protein